MQSARLRVLVAIFLFHVPRISAQPVVAIDEAHKNTHTYSSNEFRGLVELLRGDGYRVQPLSEAITAQSLTTIDVVIMSGPGGWLTPDASLTDNEVTALMTWIRGGGSLLLILDHMPAPLNGEKLAKALGVARWHNGYAMVDVPDTLPVGPIIFWRASFFPAGEPAVTATGPRGGIGYQAPDALLADHPITQGRSESERVRRVTSFVGSAFQANKEVEPLMTMPARAVSFTPRAAGTQVWVNAERTPVGHWLQGGVVKIGKGRAALFGESGLFSGGPAADNRQFVRNVMLWLNSKI